MHAASSAGILLLGIVSWRVAVHIAHHGVGLSGDALLMLAAAVLAVVCAVHLVASTAGLAWHMRAGREATARGAQKLGLVVDAVFLGASPVLLKVAARLFNIH